MHYLHLACLKFLILRVCEIFLRLKSIFGSRVGLFASFCPPPPTTKKGHNNKASFIYSHLETDYLAKNWNVTLKIGKIYLSYYVGVKNAGEGSIGNDLQIVWSLWGEQTSFLVLSRVATLAKHIFLLIKFAMVGLRHVCNRLLNMNSLYLWFCSFKSHLLSIKLHSMIACNSQLKMGRKSLKKQINPSISVVLQQKFWTCSRTDFVSIEFRFLILKFFWQFYYLLVEANAIVKNVWKSCTLITEVCFNFCLFYAQDYAYIQVSVQFSEKCQVSSCFKNFISRPKFRPPSSIKELLYGQDFLRAWYMCFIVISSRLWAAYVVTFNIY